MAKFIPVILSILLLAGCGCVKNQERTTFPIDAYVKVYKILTFVECTSKTKNQKKQLCYEKTKTIMGSGFLVFRTKSKSLAVSAAHVCAQTLKKEFLSKIKSHSIEFYLEHSNGKWYRAEVLTTTENSKTGDDLCSLTTGAIPKSATMKMASQAPKVGDQVYSISSPMGVFHPPVVPILPGVFCGDMPNANTSMSTVSSIGGSSGGAIVNSRGRVIGVINSTIMGFPNITLTSDYQTTKNFIHKSIKELLKKPH